MEVTVTSSDGTSESVYTVAMKYGDGFTMLDRSRDHFCGIRVDGTLECWGRSHRWGKIAERWDIYKHVEAYYPGSSCGILPDDHMRCWSQHGKFKLSVAGVADVSAWSGPLCWLQTDGKIMCPYDDYVVQVPTPPEESYLDIEVGFTLLCVLTTDHLIRCTDAWPVRDTNLEASERLPTPEPETQFKVLEVGGRTVCGIRMDDTVRCWRYDDGFWDLQYWVPMSYGDIEGTVKSVSPAYSKYCVVKKSDGSVVCNGTDRLENDAPSGEFESVVTANIGIACALKKDGTLVCWGKQGYENWDYGAWGLNWLEGPPPMVSPWADDARLLSFKVRDATANDVAPSPQFDPNVTEGYTTEVSRDTASATVTPGATNRFAEVTISPADADPDTDGHQIALDPGINSVSVSVTVTSWDDSAELTYTFEIVRGDTMRRSVAEHSGADTAVGLSVADPNADATATYSLEGADAASFRIDAASGQLYTVDGVDYDHETRPTYSVTVRVADGNGGIDVIVVAITLTDVPEPPSFDADTASRSLAEHSPAGTAVGEPFTATDPEGDALTYSLEGADAAAFRIDATGQLYTVDGVDYDYAVKSTYAVVVHADDGNGGSDVIAVDITLTDVPEPPSFDADTASRSLAEFSPAGTAMGEPFTAADPEGDTLTYSLEGADAASFRIDAATGQLYTVDRVDYDYTVKSTYAVVVRADDGNGGSAAIAVVITLSSLREVPYDLTAEGKDGAVLLTWKKPLGDYYVSDYRILRHRPELGEAEPLVYVAYTNTKDTTFTDAEVESGVLYVYRVQAVVNVFGDVGGASQPVEVRLGATSQQRATNTPATGLPIITGTVQVGEQLTADTSGIADDDVLTKVEFSYQWQADGADIAGATASTYTLVDADEGKVITVAVSFTDDRGHAESLTSAATGAVEAKPNTPATGLPAISGTGAGGRDADRGHIGHFADDDGLDQRDVQPISGAADGADIADATGSTYVLTDADEGKAISVTVSFIDDAGHAESFTSAATDAVAPKPNTPATGLPAISGTVQVGETLVAYTSGISDEDGLDNASFSYQWQADGSDIGGATNAAYTLTDADEGKVITVAVFFTDDRGHAESLASAATGAVEAKPNTPATGQPVISGTVQVGETLAADVSSIADEDGLADATFAYQWQADDADIAGATDSSYRLTDADEGKVITVAVSFTDDAGNAESLTSAATAAVAAKPNTPATGQPTISGTAQVGETLTADTSGVADEDGLDDVSFTYQWQGDGSDIAGATNAAYVLVDADEGKAISVTVSFTDDAGNAESLTSAATGAVASPPPEPLTASFSNGPSSHDGESIFTFELHFSEEFSVSYKRLRDDAFEVTGGDVTRAKRLERGSNVGWRIHVRPDGDGAVSIILPETTDCDDDGAICTGDGRMLSNRRELTVSGP